MKTNSFPDNFIPYAPMLYWEFPKDLRNDVTMYFGLHILNKLKDDFNFNKSISSQIGGKHVYIDIELPGHLVTEKGRANVSIKETLFDKIYTICPFLVNKFNERLGEEKYINIFYPLNKKHIPSNFEKRFDIFYTGHVYTNQNLFSKIVKPILTENNHVCVAGGNSDKSGLNIRSVNHFDKLELNAQSRITLSYDVQPASRGDFARAMIDSEIPHSFDVWGSPIWAQYKSRTFEGFFSKSVVMHLKDEFRILEEFCEPDKHFIYFNDLNDFREKSKYILENYDEFKPMTETAYNHAVDNFTIEAFCDKFIKEL